MKKYQWSEGNNDVLDQAGALLLQGGKAIVTPTKVGYIIAATDHKGLERKFELKRRLRTKPAVVLCSCVEQVEKLAQVNEAIKCLYKVCEDKDILLGCILPWQPAAIDQYIPADGSCELIMDKRNTSCFVICFGKPSEAICERLWKEHQRLVFASSANPSGQGNRGRLEGVSQQILNGVDIAICADDYVAKQQPSSDATTHYEQGVMVSMVDKSGQLIEIPTVIRKGLAVEQIMLEMSRIWKQFDYRQGAYY
jgi:tRNA A37 threonylcarbamoyladenosine synthetase subunit TsaC/SUA5/YrdC